MNPEQADRMVNLISQMAERLGYEGARLWPQMVAMTFVRSLCWLVVDPLIVLASVMIVRKLWGMRQAERQRIVQEGHYHSSVDTMGWDMVVTITSVACGVLSGIALCSMPGALTGVLFPEATTVLHLVGK